MIWFPYYADLIRRPPVWILPQSTKAVCIVAGLDACIFLSVSALISLSVWVMAASTESLREIASLNWISLDWRSASFLTAWICFSASAFAHCTCACCFNQTYQQARKRMCHVLYEQHDRGFDLMGCRPSTTDRAVSSCKNCKALCHLCFESVSVIKEPSIHYRLTLFWALWKLCCVVLYLQVCMLIFMSCMLQWPLSTFRFWGFQSTYFVTGLSRVWRFKLFHRHKFVFAKDLCLWL